MIRVSLCAGLSSSRTGRIKGPAATPEWPTASKQERNGHKRHDLSAKQTQTETLVCLRPRHESSRANEMGSRALNGCHAEAERHRGELLPSQVSLVHASWLAAGRFCQGPKGGTALGLSESPGLLVFAVTRGQGRGSLLTPGSFMLQRPIGDGSQSWRGACLNGGCPSIHSYLGSGLCKGRNAAVEPTRRD